MTTDATRRVGVLLLAVAGACFAVGVPGLVNPAWATHAAAWLFMVGAGLPLLLLAWVEQREKSAAAGVQLRLDEARAWANELSNQEREAKLQAPTPEPVVLETDAEAERQLKTDKMEIIFRAGSAAKIPGFSYDKMDGVVGSTTLKRLHEFYCSDAGRRIWRMVSGNEGTVWNHGWGLDLAMSELLAGKIPLPPVSLDNVGFYKQDTAQQKAPRKGKPQVVIDGQAVKA